VNTDSFVDALGRRCRATDSDGGAIEIFRLCPEVSGITTTEAVLVARATRLAGSRIRVRDGSSGRACGRRADGRLDGGPGHSPV